MKPVPASVSISIFRQWRNSSSSVAVKAFIIMLMGHAMATDPAYYVCPLMGSMSTFDLSAGNTYPAIARPWGMNFWTPQTGKMGDGWQYSFHHYAHGPCHVVAHMRAAYALSGGAAEEVWIAAAPDKTSSPKLYLLFFCCGP